MAAYYNEFDPYPAQWLRNLIAAGLIAPGDVDERSITEVQPDDLRGYVQCHFFAGIGGWSLAARLAGWTDDRPLWTGSCPCQPFSVAGRQKGFADERHLWPEFRRIIAERRPPVLFGEQVAAATDWLAGVRSDLEAMGYAVGAIPVEAASAGAFHRRDRYWFVADARGAGLAQRTRFAGISRAMGGESERENPSDDHCALGNADECGWPSRADDAPAGYGSSTAPDDWGRARWIACADGKARRIEPGIQLLAHGVPSRVAKLRAIGNAIDPRPAREIIAAFMEMRP